MMQLRFSFQHKFYLLSSKSNPARSQQLHIQSIWENATVSTCIPGDGRCLFRSVVHGACLNAGRPTPGESLQRKLADELRAKVADEFIKRRADSEWFLEGDFDMYVGQMRQPQRWGGEPELLMSSHVLQMPIAVYTWENKCGGLRIIAEYGQEYDKGKTIRVLYHSCGHYDALRGQV